MSPITQCHSATQHNVTMSVTVNLAHMLINTMRCRRRVTVLIEPIINQSLMAHHQGPGSGPPAAADHRRSDPKIRECER